MARKNLKLAIFAVAALAAAGCGSSSTTLTAIDTAPPATPLSLEASMDGGVIVLSWAENTTDADFAGFLAYRTEPGDSLVLIGTPTDVTECEDLTPEAGEVNTYSVVAVDVAGNRSAPATVAVDLTDYPAAPPVIRSPIVRTP